MMKHLPLDLIDAIISLALKENRKEESEGEDDDVNDDDDDDDERIQPHVFLPFLSVCRGWRNLVERKLYTSIDLSWVGWSTSSDETCEGHATLLCRTLRERPELSDLVKALAIYLRREPQVASRYIAVIALCKALSSLTLLGYGPEDHRSFVNVLLNLNLVDVKLSFGAIGRGVFYKDEIIRLLQIWPRIETVTISCNVIQETSSDEDMRKVFTGMLLDRPLHSSLPLSKLDLFHAGSTTASAFTTLQSLSLPRLKDLKVDVSQAEGADAAFLDCLDRWAVQLEGLSVTRDPEGLDDWPWKERFAESLKRASSLKTLRVTARMLEAEALLSLSSLERIEYVRVCSSVLETMILGLENTGTESDNQAPTYLPALTSLTVVASGCDLRERLDAVCSTRRISLDFSTRLRRRFAFNAWNNWDD